MSKTVCFRTEWHVIEYQPQLLFCIPKRSPGLYKCVQLFISAFPVFSYPCLFRHCICFLALQLNCHSTRSVFLKFFGCFMSFGEPFFFRKTPTPNFAKSINGVTQRFNRREARLRLLFRTIRIILSAFLNSCLGRVGNTSSERLKWLRTRSFRRCQFLAKSVKYAGNEEQASVRKQEEGQTETTDCSRFYQRAMQIVHKSAWGSPKHWKDL